MAARRDHIGERRNAASLGRSPPAACNADEGPSAAFAPDGLDFGVTTKLRCGLRRAGTLAQVAGGLVLPVLFEG